MWSRKSCLRSRYTFLSCLINSKKKIRKGNLQQWMTNWCVYIVGFPFQSPETKRGRTKLNVKSSEKIASKSKIRENSTKKSTSNTTSQILPEFRRQNRRNERTTQRELKGKKKKQLNKSSTRKIIVYIMWKWLSVDFEIVLKSQRASEKKRERKIYTQTHRVKQGSTNKRKTTAEWRRKICDSYGV